MQTQYGETTVGLGTTAADQENVTQATVVAAVATTSAIAGVSASTALLLALVSWVLLKLAVIDGC